MSIERYTEKHWPLVRDYLDAHWRKGHPLTDKALFEWQYGGFFRESGYLCRLWIENGELIGFVGGIPGKYLLRGEPVPGLAVALWSVRPDCASRGIGYFLIQEMEGDLAVSLILGATPETTVRYGSMAGYQHSEGLHRYVMPLEKEGYQRLLLGSAVGEELGDWLATSSGKRSSAVSPAALDPSDLAEIFRRGTASSFELSALRDEEFWRWRYLRNVGFRYHLFGGKGKGGVVVARIEAAVAPDDPKVNGLQVLRIIEALPERPAFWRGEGDEALAGLLSGVLAWGRERGCVAADFQIATGGAGAALEAMGFRLQRAGAASDLLHTFSPVNRGSSPINFLWRNRGEPVERNNLYVVKSDGDMDRPNIWPLTEGRSDGST